LPLKAGEECAVKSKLKGTELLLTITTGKPETVKVPAGTFEAVPVVTKGTIGGNLFEATYWYALGVGPVKYAQGEKTIQELESFTPAKSKPDQK
jgi:hypothetical protein